jgi:hypothetical protein
MPTAEPSVAASAEADVAQELLQGGEVIVLAIRPSPWYVLIVSRSVWLTAGLVAALVGLGQAVGQVGVAGSNVVFAVCGGAAAVGVVSGALRWVGRLYILTNRRVLRIRGMVRPDVCQVLLTEMRSAELSVSVSERLVGVGTLLFPTDGGDSGDSAWECIARPAEIQQQVEQTRRRARP